MVALRGGLAVEEEVDAELCARAAGVSASAVPAVWKNFRLCMACVEEYQKSAGRRHEEKTVFPLPQGGRVRHIEVRHLNPDVDRSHIGFRFLSQCV